MKQLVKEAALRRRSVREGHKHSTEAHHDPVMKHRHNDPGDSVWTESVEHFDSGTLV